MTVLVFHATWCAPCKNFAPIVQQVAGTLGSGYDFKYVDVDKDGGLCEQMKVVAVPTIVVLADGKEVKRMSGTSDAAKLREWFA